MTRWTSLPLDEQLELVEREIDHARSRPYVPMIYRDTPSAERVDRLKALRRRLLDRRDSQNP